MRNRRVRAREEKTASLVMCARWRTRAGAKWRSSSSACADEPPPHPITRWQSWASPSPRKTSSPAQCTPRPPAPATMATYPGHPPTAHVRSLPGAVITPRLRP
eukprot:7537955-Pyramimonas_sp.AAC.1